MNITKEVKSELFSYHISSQIRAIEAEFYGLILGSGKVLEDEKPTILFKTRHEELIERYNLIVNKLFNKNTEEKKSINTTVISFQVEKEKISDFSYHLSYRYKGNDEEARSYIKGLFLSSGFIFVPDEKRSTFRIEIPFKSSLVLEDAINLLKQYQIEVNVFVRKNRPILIIESGETVSDFLVFIGASKSMLKVQELIIARSMNNMINRQTNCINANIDKSIKASLDQVKAIQRIQKTVGLNSLSDKLKEAAQLRLNNKSLSLEQLAQLTEDKTSKSGFNHRIRKLMLIAEEIEESEN